MPDNRVKTIGDELDIYSTKVSTADANAKAAIEADRKAADAAVDRDGEKVVLTTALGKTGPITKPNGDGTFSTFSVSASPTGPVLLEEHSKGVDTPIEDPTPPPPPADEPDQPPVAEEPPVEETPAP